MNSDDRVAEHDFVAGNHFDKYRSRNPLYQMLVSRFLFAARRCVSFAVPRSVLEIGCGPGDLAHRLFDSDHGSARMDYVGIDICPEQVELARSRYPGTHFAIASAYDLPFDDNGFDLVVACEVLEHLTDPDQAIAEAHRVSKGYVLVSVPWEPTWRTMNICRGKYWTRLGNTPGHVQHFTRGSIRRLVSSRFEIMAEFRPFPWTMLLGRRQ
ncbi:MAG: class I SAM-dependent methyltransferase [Planctomycetota bacterium]|nr:class I SAM-dependent methyltransferase [Planctomycetota bacterium]